MKPQLNHLIVWSRDRNAAATFFAEVMGMDPPIGFGHFTQVETGNGVTIDFADLEDLERLGVLTRPVEPNRFVQTLATGDDALPVLLRELDAHPGGAAPGGARAPRLRVLQAARLAGGPLAPPPHAGAPARGP